MTREAPDSDQLSSTGGSGGAHPQSGDSGREGTTCRVLNADSVQTWASVVSGGGGNVPARENLADIMTPDGVLILEGVDEDADGEDCTWKEQLMMLAYGNPIWMPELRKYLREEHEEEAAKRA